MIDKQTKVAVIEKIGEYEKFIREIGTELGVACGGMDTGDTQMQILSAIRKLKPPPKNPNFCGDPYCGDCEKQWLGPCQEEIESLRAKVAELEATCRNVYEVWAGSEGIPEPQTAVEAYLLRLIEQMRDEAKEGLK